jgi:hypothetical protein
MNKHHAESLTFLIKYFKISFTSWNEYVATCCFRARLDGIIPSQSGDALLASE